MTLHIREEEISRVLTYKDLIPTMEQALAEFSTGAIIQPVRTMIVIEETKRYMGVMPAVTQAVLGAKLVCFYPVNAGTDIPTHTAMIVLFRSESGEPLAVMDGRLITEMRTAAVSAAVAKHVAPAESTVLALLGSGVQAHSHLEALSHVCSFDEVRVWSPTSDHAKRFAKAHNAKALDAESAVRGADIVVTATSTHTPVLKGEWLKNESLVISVGAVQPSWRELDDKTVQESTLIVDSREACLKESGDVILSKAPIYAEAGEIFSGRVGKPAGGRIVFKSVGMASEDIATAKLVYERIAARP